jgi:ribosome-binding ATPase YchF (GTP1/OBG family)
MKISVLGITEIKPGKVNLKDPRMDEADRLVEAKKKCYAQVDVVGEEDLLTADAALVTEEGRADLILRDLEFVETRLGRNPPDAEKVVLEKIKGLLEAEKLLSEAAITPEEWQAVTAHHFYTNKPVVVAKAEELATPDELIIRAAREGGYISFLTVGGKENRAWLIKKGVSAWDAAGAIHTDIQKGFIRAEIISYDDLIAAGGETEAKRAGKQRLEIKTYIMQDYDITNFRFNK